MQLDFLRETDSAEQIAYNIIDVCKAFIINDIIDILTISFGLYYACPSKNCQVLGHYRLFKAELNIHICYGHSPFFIKHLDDLLSEFMVQCPQH